jgi:hypothetical protein
MYIKLILNKEDLTGTCKDYPIDQITCSSFKSRVCLKILEANYVVYLPGDFDGDEVKILKDRP